MHIYREFSKEEMKIAKKQLKTSSTALSITWRFYFSPVRMTRSRNELTMSAGKDVDKGNPRSLPVEMQASAISLENSVENCHIKIKLNLPFSDVGCPSVCCEYALLPLVNKEADLDNSKVEYS